MPHPLQAGGDSLEPATSPSCGSRRLCLGQPPGQQSVARDASGHQKTTTSSPALSAGMVTSFGHPTRAGPASIRCVVGGYYDPGSSGVDWNIENSSVCRARRFSATSASSPILCQSATSRGSRTWIAAPSVRSFASKTTSDRASSGPAGDARRRGALHAVNTYLHYVRTPTSARTHVRLRPRPRERSSQRPETPIRGSASDPVNADRNQERAPVENGSTSVRS